MDVGRLSALMTTPPEFNASRLLLWITGSVNAALVPYWLNWLRQFYPDVETSLMVTSMAERFVTIDALHHMVGGEVWRDSWDDPRLPGAPHIEIEQGQDCFGIFPATLNSTMRLATGEASSPTLMLLQSTVKPIAIAPTFPARNEVIEAQIELLLRRRNVVLCEEFPSFSVGRQAWSGSSGFFLPLLLEALEARLQDDRASSSTVTPAGEPEDEPARNHGRPDHDRDVTI